MQNNLRFDLKKPCNDCPFRKDAKWHGGVFSDLRKYLEKGEEKTLVHTCHKTDPRSDSPEGQAYKGELQHCAGLLLMMHQNKRMMGNYQFAAWLKKQWDRNSMDTSVKVFKNLKEMGRRYAAMAKKELAKRGSKVEFTGSDGAIIRITYRDPLEQYEQQALQD